MAGTSTIAKRHAPNGRDFFDRIYQSDLQLEAEWLRLTALLKVKSISTLLGRVRFSPRFLVEVGCGTGAIIKECKRTGLAETFLAIDFSATALGYLNASDPSIATRQADITAHDFRLDLPADAVVCSHVVEHLEDPDAFLTALHDRIDFKYAVIEVPLEDLIGHKWKLRGRDRLDNSAGHVQFFTATSFEALLLRNGFRVVARRRYAPSLSLDTIRLLTVRHQLTRGGQLRKLLTNNLLPRLTDPLWSRLYYGHYAVLCTRAGG